MIYVPVSDVNDFACYSVYNAETIRAYVQAPAYNSTSNYTDYFINSHYLSREGQQQWSTYSTLPTCIATSEITNDFYYRNDISDILVSFLVIVIVCVYFPYKIFSRAFGRWLKV